MMLQATYDNGATFFATREMINSMIARLRPNDRRQFGIPPGVSMEDAAMWMAAHALANEEPAGEA